MLNDIISISREGGKIIREGFGNALDIQFKTSVNNLVTETDKKVEEMIIRFVNENYPSHSILAEETGERKNEPEFLWIIDPLDGTTNFAHGLPIFSVSIGVVKNGEIVYGVIYDVMQDVVFSAEKGKGAFSNDRKISVSTTKKLSHSLLVTGFPYNIAENPDGALDKFTSITRVSRGVRRLGSAAIDLCYVANGIFDGFWEINLQPWDMCAGILLVEEAGGTVTNFKGEKITPFSKQICATNGKIQEELLGFLS